MNNNIIYAVIFFMVMSGFYCIGYYYNHKTPKPKGCENLKESCNGCKITSCMNHPVHDMEGEEKDA